MLGPKKCLVGFAFVVVLTLPALAHGQGQVYRGPGSGQPMEREQLSENLHVLYGHGGNVALYLTEEGVIVVDSKTTNLDGTEIEGHVKNITDNPIRFLVNTHYHMDHTGGNAGVEERIDKVSHENTRENMVNLNGDKWNAPENQKGLPDIVYDHEMALNVGGKTVRIYYMGPAHTDGDSIVYFEDEKVIHTGDLFFNLAFPYIDGRAGASSLNWVEVIDFMLTLDAERVIPGHGRVTDKAGLRKFRDMLQEFHAAVEEKVRAGKSEEEIAEELQSHPFKNNPDLNYLRVNVGIAVPEIKAKLGR